MTQKIFLTGGTGYVGRHLTVALAQSGCSVKALVRDPARAEHLRQAGFQMMTGDVRDPVPWAAELAGVDCILHLASILDGSAQLLWETNASGTSHLVLAAEAAGVPRFIYVSTVGAKNDARLPYARSVWRAEQVISESALDYLIIRATVIVGSGDPFSAGLIHAARNWPLFLLPGSGGSRHQPIAVEDVVRCLLMSLMREALPNNVVAIGGSEIISVREMSIAIMNRLGRRKPIVSVPLGVARCVNRALRARGLNTTWVPAHLLRRDHIAGEGQVERHFGFHPQSISNVLDTLLQTGSPDR